MTGTNSPKRTLAAADKPLVSIIMNCFNGETWLKEALDSVYSQTYSNWEVIFWDNASTDQSATIAKSYDERVKYFRGEKTVPLGHARNLALEKMTGEIIAILDTDDVWFPDSLERMMAVMTGSRYALCYGGIERIDQHGNTLGTYIPSYEPGNVFPQLLTQFDIYLPSMLVRKSSLDEFNLRFDENVIGLEDYCLFLQLSISSSFFVFHSIISKYRIHDKALTNSSIARWASEREYTLRLVLNNHPHLLQKYPKAFAEAYARAKYYKARYHLFQGNKRKARRELRRAIPGGPIYLALYLLLFFPTAVWNWVHQRRTHRTIASGNSPISF